MSGFVNKINDARPIGIFDSGLGGLTVARDIADKLPNESLVYVGDSGRCPYGPRDSSVVRDYAIQISRWLRLNHDVKMIIIACNTATAAGLEEVKRILDVPVLGVVGPGSRAAARITKTGRVGVIATEGTVKSGAYERELTKICEDLSIKSVPAASFVNFVEKQLNAGDIPVTRDSLTGDALAELDGYMSTVLSPIVDAKVDTLVLGCTHFPILEDFIGKYMGSGVQIVSSSTEITSEVRGTLEKFNSLAPANCAPTYSFFTTAPSGVEFQEKGSKLFGLEVKKALTLEIKDLEELDPNRMKG